MAIISLWSGNYERLGGMGPSRVGGAKQFAWKVFAVDDTKLETEAAHRTDAAPTPTTRHLQQQQQRDPPAHKPRTHHIRTKRTQAHQTTHYTHTHASSSTLVQYALMVDAGSTGSRIHVYKFKQLRALAEICVRGFQHHSTSLIFLRREPGRRARSLDVLLDEAVRVLPKSMHTWQSKPLRASAFFLDRRTPIF